MIRRLFRRRPPARDTRPLLDRVLPPEQCDYMPAGGWYQAQRDDE